MECNLQKVPFTGPKFTWSRGKGSKMILERLDRGLANEEWFLLFPMAKEIHLSAFSSDHSPLLFHVSRQPWQDGRTKRTFRFENMWVRHGGCEALIREGWKSERISGFDDLAAEVDHCGKLLTSWNKEVFGNIRYRLQQKTKELEKILLNIKEISEANAIDSCRKEISELYIKEEILWKQRAKTLWLTEGDRNTKFFHGVASRRRRNNKITKIQDGNDSWHETDDEIGNVFLAYFNNLFTTSRPSCMDTIFQVMDCKVSREMNDKLDMKFTKDEVKQALFQMNPNKAPGPDGMTACFYQKYWDILGKDI